VRKSSESAAGSTGSGRGLDTKAGVSGTPRVSTTAGTPSPKSLDGARSAGTLEMHPVLAQGLEPASPCLGQHG